MPVHDMLDFTADIILYYYSLIYNIKVTETLRLDVRCTLKRIWYDFITGYPYYKYFPVDEFESVDILNWENRKHYENIHDHREDITYEITAYLKGRDYIPDDTTHVISLNVAPFAGLTFNHGMIRRIINFHLRYR